MAVQQIVNCSYDNFIGCSNEHFSKLFHNFLGVWKDFMCHFSHLSTSFSRTTDTGSNKHMPTSLFFYHLNMYLKKTLWLYMPEDWFDILTVSKQQFVSSFKIPIVWKLFIWFVCLTVFCAKNIYHFLNLITPYYTHMYVPFDIYVLISKYRNRVKLPLTWFFTFAYHHSTWELCLIRLC